MEQENSRFGCKSVHEHNRQLMTVQSSGTASKTMLDTLLYINGSFDNVPRLNWDLNIRYEWVFYY